MNPPVTEAELQAWVDGQLPHQRRAAVDDYLAMHPDQAVRLRAYRAQNTQLRALFDPVLDEAVPPALAAMPPPQQQQRSWPRWPVLLRLAAVVALMLGSGAGGWLLRGASSDDAQLADNISNLPRRAAMAHAVYTPEVRHPVEVGADQQAHLVAWLSKRLGAQLKPPQLEQLGYTLEGGRLLPGQSGPVAQFMYRDASGERLTLYVSTEQTHNHETAFRFAQEGEVGVFYWIDGKFGYALSGELNKTALAAVASAVHAQLEPGA